ncbi:hypothetical protein [Shewanella sp. TC10]|uniref:hypothetical protein n=1 Tax=Shewanella sp. TC10 TaxID=1419739 RepID=UPI001E4FA1DC|nr:hypothetical protein [Shewanella sp. TC10]
MLKQPIVVQIEVATPRWFGRGINVTPPQFNNIVFLPQTGSAITGTKNIDGESWSYLIREVTFYPMDAGTYELPPFTVFVSVNTEEYGIVEGEVTTDALQFTATLPDVLLDIAKVDALDRLIVSPSVSLSVKDYLGDEVLDDTDKGFEVGEAVTRDITIKAAGTPSMMLPVLTQHQINGLSIYQQPTTLSDKSNRGELIATAEQTTSYIFETRGQYKLPSQTLYWYNYKTDNLTELTIPAVSWHVEGNAAAINNAKVNSTSIVLKLGMFCGIIIALMLLIRLYVKHKNSINIWCLWITGSHQRHLRQQLRQHFVSGEYQQVCLLLYDYFEQQDNRKRQQNRIADQDTLVLSLRAMFEGNEAKLVLINKLLSNAFSGDELQTLSLAQFNQLLKVDVTHHKKTRLLASVNLRDDQINLN